MNRIERAPRKPAFDSKSRRVLAEMPLFFQKWRDLRDLRALSTELFWINSNSNAKALNEVLDDPLLDLNDRRSARPPEARPGFRWWCLEKSFRPGVTDNAGQVLAEAIKLVSGESVECRSGSRLWLELPQAISESEVKAYGAQVFHNSLIESFECWDEHSSLLKDEALFEAGWVSVKAGEGKAVERFDLNALTLPQLEALSAERLWALSREELQCIQGHFKKLKRPMTDVEIEVLAQTWSEHCKHKIFAAHIDVKNDRDDMKLPSRVESVFKTYIRGATREIPAPYLKSVFEDNAGVIGVTDAIDCAIKVETHNSPSALDPYGGALTGIVGVNRDILGVGLGAEPIANLDVFCVGPLDAPESLPPRLHHPRRILEGVRTGVEHGGNKSGIPTVTGAVVHHPGFLGKPLIFCGTIGVIDSRGPADRRFIDKSIAPGDFIVMAGGRIGKDGIHGATFSSVEMNESSPVSAVQLGDPLTQKRVWDFLIEARDAGLFRAVTDNGAGGLSSSVGELARLCGKRGGARMDVFQARTKYPGLQPFELVISESQERMSFAVAPQHLEAFKALAGRRGVECSVLGTFEDSGRFEILYKDETVADLDMHFLHEGLPTLQLKAHVTRPEPSDRRRYGAWRELREGVALEQALPAILGLPNVRTRRPIVEQYDHEVQARTVRKPYGTPKRGAPNDGATLRLSRESHEGVALGLGLAPHAAEIDPKTAAELALDEALRNAAVAGMDPGHAALVDNFCWPDPLPGPQNPDAEQKLGALVLTCQRLYDGAVTLRMPFVSGKDSMKNDYRMGQVKISVPPTVLITAMGKVHDVRRLPVGFSKGAGRRILWVSGQSVIPNELGLPRVDFGRTKEFLAAFHRLIKEGRIESAHDVSDGGWLVATAEMLFGTGMGAELRLDAAKLGAAPQNSGEPEWAALFGEPATSFVLLTRETEAESVRRGLNGFTVIEAGQTKSQPRLSIVLEDRQTSWDIDLLEQAYQGNFR